ncbi:MAG TPA: SgcJ/EcaC family oxidoreductase [Pseudonocardiaceae bacterium]|jgi:uncharacterized protein (TIGR02246 family)
MTTTETDVLATIAAGCAAWAADNAAAFVADNADNAAATLPGAHLPNRDAIHATMVNTSATSPQGSRAHHRRRQVRFVTSDTVVVTSAVRFAGQDEPAEHTRTLDTWVLARRDGRCWVEVFHSSPAQAAG